MKKRKNTRDLAFSKSKISRLNSTFIKGGVFTSDIVSVSGSNPCPSDFCGNSTNPLCGTYECPDDTTQTTHTDQITVGPGCLV